MLEKYLASLNEQLRYSMYNIDADNLSASYQAEVGGKMEDIVTLVSTKLADLQTAVAGVSTAVTAVEGRISSMEATLTELRDTVSGMDTRLTGLTERVQALEEQSGGTGNG